MASRSAEAEDVDLYIASVQGDDWERDEISLYEKYIENGREGFIGF